MKRLTKKDREALLAYVLGIASTLRLNDWKFLVGEGASKGSWADSVSTYGKREFTIWFAEGLRRVSREQVRETTVHELLHAHLQPTWQYLKTTLPLTTGKKATHAIRSACLQREEEAVNDLARAIAPHFPLIKWPK